jgi:hypothetical protein
MIQVLSPLNLLLAKSNQTKKPQNFHRLINPKELRSEIFGTIKKIDVCSFFCFRGRSQVVERRETTNKKIQYSSRVIEETERQRQRSL